MLGKVWSANVRSFTRVHSIMLRQRKKVSGDWTTHVTGLGLPGGWIWLCSPDLRHHYRNTLLRRGLLTRGSMPTTCNQIDAGKVHVDFAGKDSPIKTMCVTHSQDQSQREEDLLCRDGPGSSHDDTVLSTGKDSRKSYSFSPFGML